MKRSFATGKKTVASLLIFALTASTSMTVFAASSSESTNSANITVNGSYRKEASAKVVSVEIQWENMEFIYSEGNKGTWNPETHAYEGATEGGWTWNHQTGDPDRTAPAITVWNHSNTDVNVAFAFESSVTGVNGSFRKYGESANDFADLTNNTLTLATAVDTEFEDAPQEKTYFSVDGTGITGDTLLGTITVTVNTEEASQS